MTASNLFQRLRELVPLPPVLVGIVREHHADDTSTVEIPGSLPIEGYAGNVATGSLIRPRGRTVPVGKKAFVRAGVIETQAPDDDAIDIPIGVVILPPPPPPPAGFHDSFSVDTGLDGHVTDSGHAWVKHPVNGGSLVMSEMLISGGELSTMRGEAYLIPAGGYVNPSDTFSVEYQMSCSDDVGNPILSVHLRETNYPTWYGWEVTVFENTGTTYGLEIVADAGANFDYQMLPTGIPKSAGPITVRLELVNKNVLTVKVNGATLGVSTVAGMPTIHETCVSYTGQSADDFGRIRLLDFRITAP